MLTATRLPAQSPSAIAKDLVGDEAVRVAVHGLGRRSVGCLHQAEDLPVLPVDPVAQVVHPVLALDLQIGGGCLATSSSATGLFGLRPSMNGDIGFSFRCVRSVRAHEESQPRPARDAHRERSLCRRPAVGGASGPLFEIALQVHVFHVFHGVGSPTTMAHRTTESAFWSMRRGVRLASVRGPLVGLRYQNANPC